MTAAWEYRSAHGGAAAYWARQPDDFERAVGGADAVWPRESPRIPADLTRAADLLCGYDDEERAVLIATPTGVVYGLQRLERSEEAGVAGAVTRLAIQPADPQLATSTDNAPEADELAALLVWCVEGGLGTPIPPEAWRALGSTHPLADRIRAEQGVRCALVDYPEGLGERLTGGGARGVGRHHVALMTIDWERSLERRDWEMYAWLEGSSATWRGVQALVPPLPYLAQLIEGRVAAEDSAHVTALIHTLSTPPWDIPLDILSEYAQRLDAMGLPHHLREATPEEVSIHNATAEDYGIFAGETGLRWRHPPVAQIDGPDLAMLALGPQRDLVPAELVAACKHALETEPADPEQGLYWWQLGVELSLPKLFEAAALHDALRWAETAVRHAPPAEAIRWNHGLLALGEATMKAQGPLVSVLATRLARLVGEMAARSGGSQNQPGEGSAQADAFTRCLRLVAVRDRKALLGDLGLTLTPLPAGSFGVRTQTRPSLDELPFSAGRGQA